MLSIRPSSHELANLNRVDLLTQKIGQAVALLSRTTPLQGSPWARSCDYQMRGLFTMPRSTSRATPLRR
jgi:hypothetical protein